METGAETCSGQWGFVNHTINTRQRLVPSSNDHNRLGWGRDCIGISRQEGQPGGEDGGGVCWVCEVLSCGTLAPAKHAIRRGMGLPCGAVGVKKASR